MYLIKKITREYFVFHKQEKQSLTSVTILSIILLLIWSCQKYFLPFALPDEEMLHYQITHLEGRIKHPKTYQKTGTSHSSASFIDKKWEVNEMSVEDWIEFGLTQKQAHATLGQLRKKKGVLHFEDLEHIKYIPSFLLNKYRSALIFSKKAPKQKNLNAEHTPKIEPFDLNSINQKGLRVTCEMDSVEIKNFMVYRKRLGGFYSSSQIEEINGLDSTSKNILLHFGLPDTGFLKKIKLNYISIKDLSFHPYFSYNMSTAIVNYRYKHGPYEKVEDLLKLVAMTPEHFQKIRPYLSIEP